jgi:hypothetical protein
MARLASYMSAAGRRALPDAVVLEAKNHILDTLAAAISGSELPPGIQALKFARAYGGNGRATILASDLVAGPIEAAIVNGALAPTRPTRTTAPEARIPDVRSYRRRSPWARSSELTACGSCGP